MNDISEIEYHHGDWLDRTVMEFADKDDVVVKLEMLRNKLNEIIERLNKKNL